MLPRGRGMDRLTEMEAFATVVDQGGFTDAARKLGISKSDAQSQYLAYHEGRKGFARQSYKSKGWLMDVAAEVGSRAQMYHSQLSRCLR